MDLKILIITLMLNQIDESNLELLTNSLNLEKKENKIDNIKAIQNYMRQLNENEFVKYEDIIKKYITSMISNENNKNKFKNDKRRKRRYIDIFSERDLEKKKMRI